MAKNNIEKDGRGGPGRNQGRKKQYAEPTDTMAFRWPESFIEDMKDLYPEDRNMNVYLDMKRLYGPKLQRTYKLSKNAGTKKDK